MHLGRRIDPIGGSVAGRKTDMNQSKERGTSNNTIRSRSEVERNTYARKTDTVPTLLEISVYVRLCDGTILTYRIARNFRGVKLSQMDHQLAI